MPTFNRVLRGGRSVSGNAEAPRSSRGNSTAQVDTYWSGIAGGTPNSLVLTYGLQGAGGGTTSSSANPFFSSGAAAGVFRTATITLATTSNKTFPVVIGAGGANGGTAGNSTTWNSITATGGNPAVGGCGASNADFAGECGRLGGDFVCGGTGTRLDTGQSYGGGAGSHANACTNGSGGLGHFEQFTSVGTGIGGGGGGAPAVGGANMQAGVTYGGAGANYGGGTVSAPANRGGGAAGGGGDNSASGGSGRMYIKYLTADAVGLVITGGAKTFNGSFTVHDFTANTDFVITRT
jgi:hypothetical protein